MHAARNRWSIRDAAVLAIVITMVACSSGGGVTSSSAPASTSDIASATDSPDGSPATPTGSDTTAADGIYAVTISERDAADAGVPKSRYSDVVGDYELDLVRGQLAMYFTGVITLDLLRGTYTVRGNELELASDGGPTLTLTWARDHGGMSLTLVETSQPGARAIDEMIFSAHTWKRTG
jgi:hypothetical protein